MSSDRKLDKAIANYLQCLSGNRDIVIIQKVSLEKLGISISCWEAKFLAEKFCIDWIKEEVDEYWIANLMRGFIQDWSGTWEYGVGKLFEKEIPLPHQHCWHQTDSTNSTRIGLICCHCGEWNIDEALAKTEHGPHVPQSIGIPEKC